MPFRAAIAGGVDAIMSAHIQVPQLEAAAAVSKLDGKPITLPATLSPRILTGVLREQLGFQGVIVTDALNMKAIADHFGSEEAAVMAVKAGADMLLMPPEPAAAVDAIHRAVDAGELEPARIDDSVRRILRMKRKYGLLPDTASPPGALEDAIQEAEAYFQSGSAEETADRIASEAATVWGTAVKKNLPLLRGDGRRIILIGDNRTALERVQREIVAAASSMSGGSIRVDARAPADAPSPRQWPDGAIAVWVAQDLHHDRDSAEKASSWFQAAGEHGIAAAVLSVGTPYDMTELPDIPLGIAVYGTTPSNLRAGVQALFSAEPPSGKLPVALPQTDIQPRTVTSGLGAVLHLPRFGTAAEPFGHRRLQGLHEGRCRMRHIAPFAIGDDKGAGGTSGQRQVGGDEFDPRRPRDEGGDERDAHSGGDQRLHGLDIAALEYGIRPESGLLAQIHRQLPEALSPLQQDERLILQGSERNGVGGSSALGQKGMIVRDGKQNLLVDERLAGEGRIGQRQREQAKIVFSLSRHPLQVGGRCILHEHELDIRVDGMERRKDVREQVRARNRHRPDDDLAFFRLADIGHFAF